MVRDAIRLITQHGWVQVRQRGSHRQFGHRSRSGVVTVPGHPNDDLAPGTCRAILNQAGLHDEDAE